jgi:hypothetical protein
MTMNTPPNTPSNTSVDVLPVIGQIATTATVMRAAADLIEQAGIAGLSVTCEDEQISVQVGEHLGDVATRAVLVARLAAAIGTIPVRADSPAAARSWVRAEASIAGLPVKVFTAIPVQHTGGIPLACDSGGNIALATGEPARRALPPGWRWLTDLDPAPGQVA